MTWTCPTCHALRRTAFCSTCGTTPPDFASPVPRSDPAWTRPAWMDQPAPCTAEENYRAAQNVRAVLDRDITLHQAHLVLNAIFRGRELDPDVTVCACGLAMPSLERNHEPMLDQAR